MSPELVKEPLTPGEKIALKRSKELHENPEIAWSDEKMEAWIEKRIMYLKKQEEKKRRSHTGVKLGD